MSAPRGRGQVAATSPETRGSPVADERALVARIRAGDAEAFRAIFLAYSDELVAYGERLVGSNAIAEEIVHDVLLGVWQGRASWVVRDSVRSYLFGAVRNRGIHYLKHERVEWRWRERVVAEARTSPLSSSAPAPGEHLRSQALDAALGKAIAGLPDRCREVFTLRWQRGLSYAEIADVKGISVRTVENHLARALHLLRDKLTGWNRSDSDPGE
jgi:RNA polymerase sigma-70 factor (ECF subfamily)